VTRRIAPGVAFLPAAVLLLVAILRPPEIHPDSHAALGLFAPLALAACAAGSPLRRARVASAAPWFALAAVVAGAHLFVSPRPHAALLQMEGAALAVAAFLVFREGPPGSSDALFRIRGPVPGLLALAGAAAALVALQQRVIGFEWLAQAVAEQNLPFRDEALARIASGRVFGPLMLPASHAGFFALSLPVSVALAVDRSRGRAFRFAAGGAAGLQLAALALTGSIAGIAALGVAAAVTAGLCARGRVVRIVLVGGVLLAAGLLAAAAIPSRGFDWARLSDPNHPAGLRLGNWRAGIEMLADRPATGTGGGGYAAFYSRFMKPGMNETRHAHNSWLEVVVEYGPAAAPLAALFALAVLARWRRACRAGALTGLAAAGLPAFLLHNVVDFTAYQPGVLVPFAALLGALWDAPAVPSGIVTHPHPEGDPGRRASNLTRTALAVSAVFAAGVALHAVAGGSGDWLLERAQRRVAEGDLDGAVRLAARAESIARLDPSPPAFQGSLDLEAGRGSDAASPLRRAAARDPFSARLEFLRGVADSRSNRPADAWLHFCRAESLHPLSADYRLARETAESALKPAPEPGRQKP